MSTNMVAIGAIAVFGMVAASDFAGRLYDRTINDNTTPLVQTLKANPESVTAAQGDAFVIDYNYSRRPGCVGTVEYRLEGTPKGWGHPVSIPIARYNAGWKEGLGTETAKVLVPPDMWPGDYTFTFITTADHCQAKGEFKASSKVIQNRSIPVKVTVLPKETP